MGFANAVLADKIWIPLSNGGNLAEAEQNGDSFSKNGFLPERNNLVSSEIKEPEDFLNRLKGQDI